MTSVKLKHGQIVETRWTPAKGALGVVVGKKDPGDSLPIFNVIFPFEESWVRDTDSHTKTMGSYRRTIEGFPGMSFSQYYLRPADDFRLECWKVANGFE